eukprot:GILI01017412.1.p1 GENE.GILI01017412.1~~GILI01017412.1.p1  ORF type:complete len:544 (-),score=37.53 GILI01017412.1:40-1584(-)
MYEKESVNRKAILLDRKLALNNLRFAVAMQLQIDWLTQTEKADRSELETVEFRETRAFVVAMFEDLKRLQYLVLNSQVLDVLVDELHSHEVVIRKETIQTATIWFEKFYIVFMVTMPIVEPKPAFVIIEQSAEMSVHKTSTLQHIGKSHPSSPRSDVGRVALSLFRNPDKLMKFRRNNNENIVEQNVKNVTIESPFGQMLTSFMSSGPADQLSPPMIAADAITSTLASDVPSLRKLKILHQLQEDSHSCNILHVIPFSQFRTNGIFKPLKEVRVPRGATNFSHSESRSNLQYPPADLGLGTSDDDDDDQPVAKPQHADGDEFDDFNSRLLFVSHSLKEARRIAASKQLRQVEMDERKLEIEKARQRNAMRGKSISTSGSFASFRSNKGSKKTSILKEVREINALQTQVVAFFAEMDIDSKHPMRKSITFHHARAKARRLFVSDNFRNITEVSFSQKILLEEGLARTATTNMMISSRTHLFSHALLRLFSAHIEAEMFECLEEITNTLFNNMLTM